MRQPLYASYCMAVAWDQLNRTRNRNRKQQNRTKQIASNKARTHITHSHGQTLADSLNSNNNTTPITQPIKPLLPATNFLTIGIGHGLG
jgi:hypothetical protein